MALAVSVIELPMSQNHYDMQYRREIDGLRAIAVVPVILFHAGFNVSSGRVRADSAALRVDKHDNGPYLAVSLLFRLESIR